MLFQKRAPRRPLRKLHTRIKCWGCKAYRQSNWYVAHYHWSRSMPVQQKMKNWVIRCRHSHRLGERLHAWHHLFSFRNLGPQAGGPLASQPQTICLRVDAEKSNPLLTGAVKLHFTGYEVVALYDTGSVGMGLGVSLIGEDGCSLWCHKIGRSITPDMRPFMTHCGRTNIKHCREKKRGKFDPW